MMIMMMLLLIIIIIAAEAAQRVLGLHVMASWILKHI